MGAYTLTGKLFEMSPLSLSYTNAKPRLWLRFPLLSGLEEDSSTPASVKIERGGRQSGEQMITKRGNRGTFIRGQLPLIAPEPPNDLLVCGRERPRVVNCTCFPLLKAFDIEQGGGSISQSQVKSAAYQTVRGRSQIKSWAWMCDRHQKSNTDRPFIKKKFLSNARRKGPCSGSFFSFQHLSLRLSTDLFNCTVLV